jgi:hypothetical protein
MAKQKTYPGNAAEMKEFHNPATTGNNDLSKDHAKWKRMEGHATIGNADLSAEKGQLDHWKDRLHGREDGHTPLTAWDNKGQPSGLSRAHNIQAWSRRAEKHGEQAQHGKAEASRENYKSGQYPHSVHGAGDDFDAKPVSHYDRKRLKRND